MEFITLKLDMIKIEDGVLGNKDLFLVSIQLTILLLKYAS